MNAVALLAAESSSSSSPLGLVILLLPIAAIVFLMIVPQRRQRQRQAELMSDLAAGDEVVTIGGVHGVINVVEDDVVHLEVDDDVVLRFSKSAISRKAGEAEPAGPAERRRPNRAAAAKDTAAKGTGSKDAGTDAGTKDQGED